MLKVVLDATTRTGRQVYQAMWIGITRMPDKGDIRDRQIDVLRKVRGLGGLPAGCELDDLPATAIEPYELQASGVLVLTEAERKVLRDAVDRAEFAVALSEARREALRLLDEAEKVPEQKETSA